MSVVDAITITSVSTVNQITISSTSGISVTTVGTQGLAGPSTIMQKTVDTENTAGANDNGAVLIYNNGTSTWTASTLNTSQSITQNIYNLRLNGANSTVTAILDQDNMASDSATALATQQSIKKYVDDNNTVQDLDIIDDSGNQIDVRINDETLGLLGGTGISSAASGTAVTFNIDATVVTLTGTQTLTNKTLTSPTLTTPVLNTSISGSAFLDEDDFASNSANKVASQQSIKAYVDTKITAEDLDITDGSNSGSIDLDSEVFGLLGGTGITSSLSGNNITLAIDNTVATLTGTQTLTNKTLTTPKLNGSTAITTTGTELNVLDGNTNASSVVVQDSDQFIVNDSGVMKQIAVTRLDTYFSATTKTLTNKTLTAPVINNGVLNTGLSGSAFLDEDDLSSNSATKVASQQSIKSYVDANITAQDLDVTDGSTNIAIDLDSETLSLLGGTGISSAASGNGVTFAIDNTVATLVGNQTLSNKTIDVDNNTLSNIELDNLKSGVLDTDLSSVASTNTTIASAKAIKTYVDANVTAQDLDITDGSSSIAIDLDSETLSLLGGTGVTSTASGNGVTFAIGQSVATGDNVVFNQVTAALVGNSSTATALQTARTIGGVSFNGTSNINLAGVNTAGNQNTSGNSATTTALATARTIALSGDVTASGVSFDGTGNISLSTTIAANSVALGTDTTGNYVAAITGSSNEIEVTNSGGENRTVNVGLPNNVIISGNLTVNGTTTTTDTNELHVTDPLIKLAKDNTSNSLDIGFYGQYRASGSTNQFAGLFRDQNDSGKFKLFELLQNEPTTTVNTSGTGYAVATLVAAFEGNLIGNVTGNTSGTSATVTGAAQTNITSLGTLTALQVDNININGNTISSTAGTDLNITPLSGQQIVLDGAIIIDAGVVTGATSITSTDFVGDLTGDVTGNASGNAGTATVLATSRNFSVSGDITASAVAFNGSGNVVLSASIDDNVVGAAQLNISGNGSLGQAILSDGDGSFSYGDASKTTEQIQDIVGGMVTSNTETGITVTYEDGDGTLDFVINPAQTTITSLLATDIKIGEDDQTKIDFETADEIHFYAANAQQIKLIDGAIVPVTNNDIDLGTSSLEFKNAFFDGTITSDAFAGALTGNVTGDISGNAGTATLLQTARTIGGTSFNGSANIAIALANTATTLATARTIGGVSFDGSANINLAGVNATGNQDTSGNAATATALATARTIGGTSFNGTANIAIALANTATTLATARTIQGVSFNGSANITTLTAGTGVSVSGTEVSIGQAVATSNSPTFANLTLGGTDSIKVPSGTTSQRNGSPANGMFRYNSTNAEFEGYQSGEWGAIAGGGASAMETNNFTGNGSTRAYTVSSNVVNEDNLIVFIDGVYQNKGDYVASGTTLTFDTAPVNGRDIVVHHVRSSVAGSSMVSNNFTGNGSTTAYTLSISPSSELNTQIYIDGVYQSKTTYAVSGTTLTFDTAPVATTAIEVIIMSQTSINVPASDSVTTSMIQDANVTTSKILNSNITLAKMAANSVDSNQYVDGSIDTAHIADSQITSAKIADGTIVTADLANDSVDGSKLTNNIDIAGTLDVTGLANFDSRVGMGVAAHSSAALNITTTNQHIRLNNGAELGVISLLSSGELELWGHGDTESINFRTGSGSGTVVMNVVGSKVGILNTGPNAQLHIGDANAEGSSANPALQIGGGSTYRLGLYTDAESGIIQNLNGDDGIQFRVKTAGEAMRIDGGTGNVGVGDTNPSSLRLSVVTPTANHIGLQVVNSNTSDSFGMVVKGGNDANDYTADFRKRDNTNIMRIRGDGNVGIGTTSPAFENGNGLEIRNSSGNGSHLKLTDNASGTGATQGFDLYMFNSQAYIENYENAPTIFRNNGGESARIDASGKVGIGCTASSELTVQGALSIRNATQNFNGGLAAEVNTGIMNFGINEGSGNRFGGSYTQANQGGMLNFDTRSGEPLFQIYGRAAGTANASGTALFNLLSDGKVGIGNTSPQAKIHATIEGSVPTISSNTVAVFNRSGGASHEAYMSIIGGTGGACTIQFGDTSDEDAGRLEYRHDTNHMAFYTNASEKMRIESGGGISTYPSAGGTFVVNENGVDADFRIESDNESNAFFVEGSTGIVLFGRNVNSVNNNGGYIAGSEIIMSMAPSANTYLVRNTSSSSYVFYVSGSGVVNAVTTTINGLSDIRLKENIVDLQTGLLEIMALKPRKFDWKEGEGSNEKNVTGFIAQEVETVLPDLIGSFKHDDLDDAKSIKMGDMVPTLVKAIQEQQAQIEILKTEIQELKDNG